MIENNNTNYGVVSFRDHLEINDDIEALESALDDELLDNAVSFDVHYNPATDMSKVEFYDQAGSVIGSVEVSDPDVALIYLEEYFGIDFADQDDRDPDAAASGSAFGHNTSDQNVDID